MFRIRKSASLPLASLTPHTTSKHETSDHEMPKPAPLFQQKTMPLCCASSCLPLLARQGPSLPVLRLFKRLLVLRNLQARSSRTKPLPFSISSTPSELGSVQHNTQLASVHTCRPVACQPTRSLDQANSNWIKIYIDYSLRSPSLPAPAYDGASGQG